MVEIRTNPSIEEVDADLEKADLITVIHSERETEIKDFLVNYKNNNEIKLVYYHHYTKDKIYTIGVKVIK